MKTNINLYHACCQPQKMHFNFSQLIILFVACIVFSVFAAFATIEFANNSESQEINAQGELLILQNKFTSLLETETKSSAAEKNKKIKNELLQGIDNKEKLLIGLNTLKLKEGLNFPGLMLGLSETNIDKLTLTRFSIFNHKLSIQGQAKQGELIPQWLARMQMSPELKAVTFDNIKIIKQNQTFLFQVNTINSTNQGSR